jgi:iron complex outermembrane receptor protein
VAAVTRIPLAVFAAGVLCAAGPRVRADAPPAGAPELSAVVITATRQPEPSFDLPVSIDRVGRAEIHEGQLQVNLAESLMTVPGVSAESRQNYAQDLQLSIRGFGARSSFGVRGVRLYSDGIPGTMPDGQGQFSQFDLGSADHIEVLRGPFSALYGNSSGGVIAIFSESGTPGFHPAATAEYGTFNTQRYALKASGGDADLDYVADLAHFQTDGYRVHSAAERNNFNSKMGLPLGDGAKLSVVANAVEAPDMQDPLGLTAAKAAADPSAPGVGALTFDTRKSVRQEQLGMIYENPVSGTDDFTGTVYAGSRATRQFQAIPLTTEAAPTSPGGVIELSRAFWGVDLHVRDHRDLGGAPLLVIAGVAYDDLEESRQGYLNFVGDQLGVAGATRRDEANHVYDLDEYLQADWDPAARWRVLAGVRNSVVEISDHNHLPAADGAVQSGVRYGATDPVAGVTFKAAARTDLYVSYGKGFETPTLDDLAYRSTNGSLPGLNLGLRPARSDNYEAGLKTAGDGWRADAALFSTEARDELAVQANAAGRSVYQNIGETKRRGLELGVDALWPHGFSARLAYTYLHAVVAEPYLTCFTAPCKSADIPGGTAALVPAGNHLPAVPMNALYAGLTWSGAPYGFTATLETQARAQIYADDRNSHTAAGYWVENVHAGFVQEHPRWRFSEFLRVDNLADRRYIGSVIVNETNSRFFEPAPGRTALIMLTAAPRLD